MLKPELLKIFVSVCETASFTDTAQALNLPKASVSDGIQKLEAELGTRLFQRTTRKVSITQDGEQFYERCKDLLADMDEAANMFQDTDNITGRIRVDMPVPIAKRIIIPRLSQFIAKYPQVEVELSCTDRRVDLVREGFDFVIRVGNLGSSQSLIAKKIGEYTIGNIASPAYLEKYGKPRSIEDLSKHFQIHYSQTLGGKTDGFEYFNGTKYVLLKTRVLITVNSTDAYYAACVAGLGIIQAPLSGVADEIKAGKLKEILTKYKSEPAAVHFVYPQRRHIPRRVRVFMDWVESELKSYLW